MGLTIRRTLSAWNTDTATLHSQSCKRDTGGPLLTWYGGSWKVTGIATIHGTSYSHSSCRGSFENVAKHALWIEKIMDEDD